MAKSNGNVAMYLNLVLLLSLLLIINMAESSRFNRFKLGHAKAEQSTPTCLAIYGAEDGDTCFGIIQAFNLTADSFSEINPNLNCDDLFVGQWLCVDGFLS